MKNFVTSKTGKTFLKYSASSVITTILTVVVIYLTYDLLNLASAGWCSAIGSISSIGPSYLLNRKWAWAKTGKSNFQTEVLPFWSIGISGIIIASVASIGAADLASTINNSKQLSTLFVEISNIGTFGILWVGRFLILNRFLFRYHHDSI